MTGPLLILDDLHFSWPGEARAVLSGLSLTVAPGERVFLAGASGSGKSTLLGLIGGLITPQQGRIRLAGVELHRLRQPQRDRLRADRIGVIFQQFNLLPWLSALANVRLGCQFSSRRRRRAGDPEHAARELLEAMGLDRDQHDRQASRLSVGQQQRVAAGRALIGQPDLVLADEPTSALDADHRDRFIELLFAQLKHSGSALLFVSHDRSLACHFDRCVELDSLHRGAAS